MSETLAAVIKGEPDWSAVPTDIPVTVRRLLRRCLQKDGKERLRDIGDARIEMRDAQPEAAPEGAALAVPVVIRHRRERLAWTVAGTAVIIGAIVASAAYFRGAGVRNRWSHSTLLVG
jgi:hypothetical protein